MNSENGWEKISNRWTRKWFVFWVDLWDLFNFGYGG